MSEVTDPLEPTPALLSKLGAIVARAHRHQRDDTVLNSLLGDPQVDDWMSAMRASGALPPEPKPENEDPA